MTALGFLGGLWVIGMTIALMRRPASNILTLLWVSVDVALGVTCSFIFLLGAITFVFEGLGLLGVNTMVLVGVVCVIVVRVGFVLIKRITSTSP